jgi:transcriptional/translational regulatory protein YebC/TACO1
MAYSNPKKEEVMKKNNQEIIAEIKNALQLPKTTLELVMELKSGKRKRIPPEFIEDALKAINDAVKLLNKLARWEEGGKSWSKKT